MRFANIQSFIRGIFENDGKESRIQDQFLVKLHNVDIDLSGKLTRRRGYTFWGDLENNESDPALDSQTLPDTSTYTGFGKKVQGIYAHTDIDNNRYVIMVSDGKIYIEYYNSGAKTWSLLNPSGDYNISDPDKRVDIVSYLDLIFFNDYRNNIMMYNTKSYNEGGWIIIGNRYVYFAEDRIYFRDYTSFAPTYHTHAITGVNQGTKTFTIAGDYRHRFEATETITISGSTGNDGDYTVVSTALSGSDTDIVVSEAIPDATVDGNIATQYRIKIQSNQKNIEGNVIYDGLDNIAYPYKANLKLGYCLKVGSELAGFTYYVLDNAKNQRADNKCQIIKFNDRFIAQDYVEFTMDAAADIINFSYYNEYLYLWCKDGEINKIDSDLVTTVLNIGDVASMAAPINNSSKKQYSIAVNADGIHIYTYKLPVKTDWWQPIIMGDFDFTADSGSFVNVAESNYHSSYYIDYAKELLTQESLAKLDMRYYTKTMNSVPLDAAQYYYRGYVYPDPDGAFGQNPNIGQAELFRNNTNFYFNPYRNFFRLSQSATQIKFGSTGTQNIFLTGEWRNYPNYRRNLPFPSYQYESYYHGHRINNNTLKEVSETSSFPLVDIKDISSFTTGSRYSYETTSKYYFQLSNHVSAFNQTGAQQTNRRIGRPSVDSRYGVSIYARLIDGYSRVSVDTSGFGTWEHTFNYFDIYENDYREGIAFEVATKKLSFHSDFSYDKEGDNPADKQIWTWSGSNLATNGSFCMLKDDASYDSSLMSDMTTSNYVLLVILDEDGNLKEKSLTGVNSDDKTWRYIVPLGKTGAGELRDVVPIVLDDTYAYFGTSMLDGAATGQDNGKYYKFDFANFEYETSTCEESCQRHIIEGSDQWLMRGSEDSTYFKTGTTWDWNIGFYHFDNYIDKITYGSNLVYHVYKQVADLTDEVGLDRIQYLGTPKIATITMDYDATSTLVKGTKLVYQIAYKFYSGLTTNLSLPSEEIIIPDMGGGATEPVKIVLTNLNLLNLEGLSIYQNDDIEEIQVYRKQLNSGETVWSEPILISTIAKTTPPDFDADTVTDNTQTYTYNPFTVANVKSYPVNHIVVHKNRLVLINKTDEDNPSFIFYSNTDMAEAIPASQFRTIYPGDGDALVKGVSIRDYLYLFKTSRIYAILGDVFDGQDIDIDQNIGSPYKDLIIDYNSIVYFMNKDSVYALANNRVFDINRHRLDNYFDPNIDNSIDFDNIEFNGFSFIDKMKKEVYFFVPQKEDGTTPTDDNGNVKNNLVLVYNTEYDYWRTYSYYHSINNAANIRNISTNENEQLLTDNDGKVYMISKDVNDFNNTIKYIVRTKAFTVGTKAMRKAFKIIKMHGKYLENIYITYWVDAKKQVGKISYRANENGSGEALLKLWSNGRANEIVIEINGEDLNEYPFEIDELLLGFTVLKGLR